MEKIKPIDHIYTMEEITKIVDNKYPCEEYNTIEDERYIYIDENNPRNFEFDHCKKRLMDLFFTLNNCNRIIAGQYREPLTPEECDRVIADRESAFGKIQEILNPAPEAKPQQEKKRLFTITDEGISGLKEFFIATFKGMGNNNPDRFDENLIPALKQCQNKRDLANLFLACYNSDYLIDSKKPNSWNKWKDVVCRLFEIESLPYKPGELERPDFNGRFYWLKRPPQDHK